MKLLLAGVVAVAVAACSDQLDVTNTNAPDAERALRSPTDVENLVGSSYQAVHASTLGGSNDAIQPQTLVMGMESYSDLANFGMNLRSPVPRPAIDNTRGNAVQGGNYRDFLGLHRAARQAATGLSVMNRADFAFLPVDTFRTNRAKAWGNFVVGVALGNVALIYDQGAAVAAENTGQSEPVPLIAYDSLMTYALAQIDAAIALATPASRWGTYSTEAAWLNGLALTPAQFIALARGYKARFRAGVARTPADRAAVDWATVIADANAALGQLPNGLVIPMAPAQGWDISWPVQHFFNNSTNWHCMHQYIIGMADSSGGYDTWLNTPVLNRTPFLVVTADRRFPQGTDRATQRTNSATVGNGGPPNPYIRNRSVPDWQGAPLGTSWYDHYRWQPFYAAGRVGNFPVYTATELRMLAAEGYIRTGQFDQAAALINVTRTAWGLPALPNGMTATTQVPGNDGNPGTTGCVPRIPVGPGYTTTQCGTILEAMKWEKRMETAFTGPYMWYLDGRGWGDLPVGTALMWPTPFQEIDTRQTSANPPPYVSGYGGVGGTNAAPVGNYGL
jgi:hypothetical protein